MQRERLPELCARVVGEYTEMPGLSLTLLQASRLWNVDPPTCTEVLDQLREIGFLRQAGRAYVRMNSGRSAA
jgi:Mn-dependent DtxR family transcriptional regulator